MRTFPMDEHFSRTHHPDFYQFDAKLLLQTDQSQSEQAVGSVLMPFIRYAAPGTVSVGCRCHLREWHIAHGLGRQQSVYLDT